MSQPISSKQSDLSIPFTVAATLRRAKGSLLAKYPTQTSNKDSCIQFDIRYPGEPIPNSPSKSDKELDLSTEPVYVSISRPDMHITLSCTKSLQLDNQQNIITYSISAHHFDKNYRSIVFSNNYGKEFGDKQVLDEIQKDKEFAQYVSFVRYRDIPNLKPQALSQWNLVQEMDKSRGNR